MRPSNTWRYAASIVALFFLTLGTWVWALNSFGYSVPVADAWDIEPADYIAMDQGQWPGLPLLYTHNEHLVIVPRLLWAAIYWLNDGWNPLLQITVNAVLHSVWICLLAWVLLPLVAPRLRPLALLLLGVAGACPISEFNMLQATQAQFYLCLIFQTLAVVGLTRARTGSAFWFGGLATGLLAMGSLASGVLAFAAAAVVCAGRLLLADERRSSTDAVREWIGVSVLIAAAFIGWFLTPEISFHQNLKAQDPGQFIHALARLLAFPFTAWYWMPLMLILPAHHVVGLLRRPDTRWNVHAPVSALLVLVLLSAGATAMSRANTDGFPSDRYLDIMTTLTFINIALGLGLCANQTSAQPRPAWMRRAALLCVLVILAGLGYWVSLALAMMNDTRQTIPKLAFNAREYLRTGEDAWLFKKGPVPYYTDPAKMKAFLDDTRVRAIVPETLRFPLEFVRQPATQTADGQWVIDWFCTLPEGTSRAVLPVRNQRFTTAGRFEVVDASGAVTIKPPILSGPVTRYYFDAPAGHFILRGTFPAHVRPELVYVEPVVPADRLSQGLDLVLALGAPMMFVGLGVLLYLTLAAGPLLKESEPGRQVA